MRDKKKRLFDQSRGLIFTQNVEDMDKWIEEMQSQMDTGAVKEKATVEAGIESMATMESHLLKQEVPTQLLSENQIHLQIFSHPSDNISHNSLFPQPAL